MFGSNAFGWPYYGQGYAGSASTGGTVSFTIVDTFTTSAAANVSGAATLTVTDTFTTAGSFTRAGSCTFTITCGIGSDGGQPAMGVSISFGTAPLTAVPDWTRLD